MTRAGWPALGLHPSWRVGRYRVVTMDTIMGSSESRVLAVARRSCPTMERGSPRQGKPQRGSVSSTGKAYPGPYLFSNNNMLSMRSVVECAGSTALWLAARSAALHPQTRKPFASHRRKDKAGCARNPGADPEASGSPSVFTVRLCKHRNAKAFRSNFLFLSRLLTAKALKRRQAAALHMGCGAAAPFSRRSLRKSVSGR